MFIANSLIPVLKYLAILNLLKLFSIRERYILQLSFYGMCVFKILAQVRVLLAHRKSKVKMKKILLSAEKKVKQIYP